MNRRNFLGNAFNILPAATLYTRNWRVLKPEPEPSLELLWHRYQRDFESLHLKYARIMPLRWRVIDGRLYFYAPAVITGDFCP